MSFIDNLRNSLADLIEYGPNVEEGKKRLNVNPTHKDGRPITEEDYNKRIEDLQRGIDLMAGISSITGATAGTVLGSAAGNPLGGAALGGTLGGLFATAVSQEDKKKAKENAAKSTSSSSTETESEKEEEKEEEVVAPQYDVDEMAGEFILGAWGNGQDRIDNMINAGYTLDDYNKIQNRVNEAYMSGRDLHEWTNKANEKLRYW